MLIAILVFSILSFLLSGSLWAIFAWALISDTKKEKQVAEEQAACKKNEITQEQK